MKARLCVATAALIFAGAAGSVAGAAVAIADDTNLPQCTTVAGSEEAGTATTECATPGNVQLNASPPVDAEPDYPYPYDDMYWGPALVMGNGGGWGPHGGGGGGGGGHR
jgi:hypothetical protein